MQEDFGWSFSAGEHNSAFVGFSQVKEVKGWLAVDLVFPCVAHAIVCKLDICHCPRYLPLDMSQFSQVSLAGLQAVLQKGADSLDYRTNAVSQTVHKSVFLVLSNCHDENAPVILEWTLMCALLTYTAFAPDRVHFEEVII